jgi:hypothetical protein
MCFADNDDNGEKHVTAMVPSQYQNLLLISDCIWVLIVDFRHAVVRDPSSSSADPDESDYGRVAGIVVLNNQLSTSNTSSDPTVSCSSNGPRLGFHVEFGYSHDDLTLMHTIDVYGVGAARTAVWDINDVLK